MPIIFLLPWLEEPENFDSCTEKCCPPIMRGSVVAYIAQHASLATAARTACGYSCRIRGDHPAP